MNALQKILGDITEITTNIETNYPELYVFLEEEPITIPSLTHPHIDKKTLQDYLEGLKLVLKNYIKTHKKDV